ncbi:RDD family protein [Gleimia sp. 6138-11-ORH1]|uniref:RDD family protein n=1 Tax=Gleimia sp. 6138-11-ORH1 TaxID=2973937 RepID=UPI0021687E86|nr:RDD family protein [Gleimia sp. 6138-11-ORH1]MCS4485084.1 RDD family protein [Gleimia sp. 6138-11-ORH1]
METQNHLVADDIIVGEGVALDVPKASPVQRISAALIDAFITVLLISAVFYTFSNYLLFSNAAIARTISISVIVFFLVVMPTLIETLSKGKSVGRFIMGTRVVRTDHGAISFRHAFTRAMIGVIEIWLSAGSIAAVSVFFSKHGLRVGDFAAGTLVIVDRIPLRLTQPILMPKEMEAWASSADIGSIPTPTALSARQFLLRKDTLAPASRQEIGLQLAQQLQEFVYPLPAQMPHPEVFISAILAERSRRATQRALANQKIARTLLRQ